MVEWLRVATVFTETRFSTNVEKDDVFQVSRLVLKSGILWLPNPLAPGQLGNPTRTLLTQLFFQAARILLPGADFPPRGVAFNFEFSTIPGPGLDELDFVTTVRHLMIVVMIF